MKRRQVYLLYAVVGIENRGAKAAQLTIERSEGDSNNNRGAKAATQIV
jgi:hypothetical protein